VAKTELAGGPISAFSASFLNPAVTNKHIIAASVNPLIFGTAKTVMELMFSKPFFMDVLDEKNEVDGEKTDILQRNLKQIDIDAILRSSANDSLLMGNGLSEWAWGQDPESKYIGFTGVARRPPENFVRKAKQPVSSALRWKGIYYTDDGKGFDETVRDATGTRIVTLDPEQVMCVPSVCEIAPDGPGLLEYLSSLLQGAGYSWIKIFDVMENQLTPYDVEVSDEDQDDISIAQNAVEHSTSTDVVPTPPTVDIKHNNYLNRTDVLEFHKFFQNYILWVVFPTAVLNYDGSNALLDASSGKSKTDLLFSFINTLRHNVAVEAEKKLNLWLRLNGFNRYYAKVSVPSTIPTDYQESVAIAKELSLASAWTKDEMRVWASQFSGFDLDPLPDGGDEFVLAAAIDDESKSKIDAMISSLLSESISETAEEALMPLVKRISENAGVS